MSINRVSISGNLTRDPDLRATASGTQVLGFGVAVNDRRRNPHTGEWEDYPNFVDCTMFGNRAEAISRYLRKGGKVAVEGKLRYSSWEAKDGTKRSKLEVIVDEIELMQQAQQQGGYQPQPAYAPQQAYAPQPAYQQPQPAYAPPQQAYQPQQQAYQPQQPQPAPQQAAQPVQAPLPMQQPAQAPRPAQQAQPAPQQQAATYLRDTITTVYTGRMHTEYAEGTRGMVAKGDIPQASSTYQFLNTTYPCLNEKQLGIGETTITGRRELVNKKGMFMIEELERIALQRCTTARAAIRLMGQLIERYGYGDWGECLTIADPKEVWHFEVFGEGPDKVGGVWAAVRIPDDHVGVSANIARISRIDTKDTANCMASANVFEVAKRMGFWDGKKPFRFWEAYGRSRYSTGAKAFSIREFFILNKLAPSLHLSYDAEELPISVKPDKPVAATDVMALLTETYEGTEYDMTKNLKVAVKKRGSEEQDTIVSPVANPWMTTDMVNLLNAIKPNTVKRYRLVAVPQCSYSTVIQLRDWLPDAVGGVVWLSFDNPGESPRIPIFAGTKDLPACFKICGQHRYREDAAVWMFRRTNKLATVRWGVTKERMQAAFAHFVEKGQSELPFVESRYKSIVASQGAEAGTDFLTQYTADFAGATMLRWKEMGDAFWSEFARGF